MTALKPVSLEVTSMPPPDAQRADGSKLTATKYTKSYINLFLQRITLKFYEDPSDCEALAI